MEFNLRDSPTLKVKSMDWSFDKDLDPQKLERDMIDFMIENKGIGLAANQIGLDKRIFVIGLDSSSSKAYFNPIIIESSEQTIEDIEGCLSYPDLWLKIKRPEWIVVGYYDSNNSFHEERFTGMLSKCFQHELDHLDGICFVDKVSKLKLQLAMKKQRKLNK
jgi:peptide deformylase